jgi:phosphoglycerate dehydrogenase-like enzyme
MQVVHLNTLGPFKNSLRQQLEKVADYISHSEPNLTPIQALEYLQDADIAILAASSIKPVSSSILKKLPHLKHIALVTSGYDWIDVDTAVKQGISISRPLGANSLAVAEHALGLILDLLKRISEFDRDIRTKNAYDFRHYMGTELSGKTLGILGLGYVGRSLIQLVKGFNLNVLAYDHSAHPAPEYKLTSLDNVLRQSDIVSIHLPLTDQTRHLIGKTQLRLMKKGSLLINTAREEIVDKAALISAIKSVHLSGYGIETNIMTPIPLNDDYLKYPNILINAHNAFNTREAQTRTDKLVVENVINFVQGSPQNLIQI